MKIITGILAAAFACLATGCLLDEQPPRKNPVETQDPVETQKPETCTNSPLCRINNPVDTAKLVPEQKEELITVIEATDDSATVSIATVDIEGLSDTTLRNEVLKRLQTDLLKDMQIPVDLSLLSSLSVDSLLASVTTSVSPDGSMNVRWSGDVANVQVNMVNLNIKGTEFLGGYAVVNNKIFSFMPLGGDKIAIVYDSKMVWMGECPPLAKTSRVQLSCAMLIP